jgi:putative transcriptional regulator
MSLRKLCFFTMLAMIIAFVTVGRLNVPIKGFNVPALNSRPLDPALSPGGSLRYIGQPANKPGRSRWVKAFHAKDETRPTIFLPIQSKNAKDLGAGKLLVASRGLADPNFAETVVLLVHYDAEGVVGLVLNRRTHVPLSRVLEGLKAAKDRSDPVYLGGPVETPTMFALLQSPAKLDGAQHIFGAVYLISTKTLFERTISARPDPSVFHAYLGYAGWTSDQLRKEVELGAWFIFPADASTVFNSDPDSLWSKMIRKTELKFAESEPADADHKNAHLPTITPSAPLSVQGDLRGCVLQQSFQEARLDKVFEKTPETLPARRGERTVNTPTSRLP